MSEAPSPFEPVCVVTRIQLRHWRSVPSAVKRFRALRRAGRSRVPGLVEARRFRNGKTLFFVSLWKDELALLQFTSLKAHVNAVRWTINEGAAVWSGVFRLAGMSSRSEPWIGTTRQWQPFPIDWSSARREEYDRFVNPSNARAE